jgi:genome maintenance exonuclease 1
MKTPDRPLIITPINDRLAHCLNPSKGSEYTLQYTGEKYKCECDGFHYRGTCKHIRVWVEEDCELREAKVGDRLPVFGKRHYLTPVGWLPSVTTILGATKSNESTAELSKWKDKFKEKGIDTEQVLQEIINPQGTAMHSWCEAKLKRETLPEYDCERIKALITSISPSLKKISNVVAQEKFVYWKDPKTGYGYAGSFDCFGGAFELQPNMIIDFKSSLKFKKREWIGDYLMQCAAYAAGIHFCMGHRVNGAVILIAIASLPILDDNKPMKTQPALEYKFSKNELLEAWKKWRDRLKMFYESGSEVIL